ncbi:MAG: hypothetical protein V3U54_04885 [Thermodesulfobacteriota bacterium]
MFHNPRLYKHLKAATKEASDLLHGIKSGKIPPLYRGNVNDMIASERSFKSCVRFLMEDLTIERLRNIQKPGERRKEARKMILRFIKRYLRCPYLNVLEEIL